MKKRMSSGFTLVELLVVVLIIALLIAILLPSLARAREAARKMECASRMRQIGLAMFQYEKNYQMMPNAQQNAWRQLGEYLGLRGLSWTAGDTVKSLAASTTEVFRCPSDDYLSQDELAASLSYAPIVDSNYYDAQVETPTDIRDGNMPFCAWSFLKTGRDRNDNGVVDPEDLLWLQRNLTAVAPDTAVITEYWGPMNRLLLGTEEYGGYVRFAWNGAAAGDGNVNTMGTLNFSGTLNGNGRCKGNLPNEYITMVNDVGAYTFLSAFGYAAASTTVAAKMDRIMHGGSMNLQYVDGSVLSHRLKDVTDRSPKDLPRWTRSAY
jgi:prepilin-type N-terminal cleavage/methylation domain-containing protein/prepilin-type processing-associated H-X9-DG protein